VGLAERRLVKQFQDQLLPGFCKQINELAGFEVPIEIDWDQLCTPDQAHLYLEYWPKVYFEPLIGALKTIAIDDLGKQALKDSFKKIKLQNTKGSYSVSGISFVDGVLTIDQAPCTEVPASERINNIQGVLEKGL
jgi:hypothetical protein